MSDSIDLAHVPTFSIGVLRVEPSSRSIRSDEEEILVEPRVLQLLVALAQARGSVLSRDDLIQRVWGGRVIGDNAIHRAVSRLRTIAATIGKGAFSIETVKGVGYKLVDRDVKTREQVRSLAPVARRAVVLLGSGWRLAGIAVAAVVLAIVTATIFLRPAGRTEPAALHIERFDVADPQDETLANGLRQSLASTLRDTGLVKVVGLEWMPAAALNGPRAPIPDVDETLSGRLERTGSKIHLTYSIGDSREDRGSITLPADELQQLENELARRVLAALSRTTGALAGARADRGSDYETFLIANGLIKVRGRRNVLLAEKLLRPIVQRHPDWPEAKLALAKTLYLTQGQAVEAFRLAQEVAIANPTSGLAFALMGVTSPDRRRTLGWLETAGRQEPFDAEILLFLGGAQQEQMQFERAFQTLLRVWQLEPYWVRSNQVSDAAAELGYIAMASQIDRTLAASHPQRYQRLLAQARLEMRNGEWGAALQSAKQALIDPDNPETGEAMLKVLKLGAATGQATGIEPRNPRAAIFQSLYRGVLPDRSTLERDGVPPKDFWRLNEPLLIAPALFVAAGREAELVRLYDRSFAGPREMLEHMRFHVPWGPSKFGSVAPYLALSLRELGRHEEGQRILESARALLQDAKAKGRTPTGHLVDLARIEATLGNRRAAHDLLRQARSQGWPRIGHGPLPMILTTLRDDPALRSLAGAPAFEVAERKLAELKRS